MSSVHSPFEYLVKMFESSSENKIMQDNNCLQHDVSLHEHLNQQLNELYTHPENGLIIIGKKAGVEILPPRKKISVLLIGNHSAGKSSFINWYIEENVQRTGMAIETQLFSVVASGKKRETLMGPATVYLFPHLKPLEKMEGVLDYLSTEISTSKKRQFPLITFIDTPGLVDGGMEYPYNVNDAILFLGGVADLIFIFFDPIGLALCERTMVVVEKINSLYPEKLHFYLSKSDEIRKQTDKEKIMMQITQEVCRHSGLNRSGFTLPGIFIPTLARNQVVQNQVSNCSISSEKAGIGQVSDYHNEIEDVCKQIDMTINRALQIALHNFDKDINTVLDALSDQLITNKRVSEQNWTYFIFSSLAVVLLFGLLLSTGLQYMSEHQSMEFLTTSLKIHPNLLQPLILPGKLMLALPIVENKTNLYIGYLLIISCCLYFFLHKMKLKPTLPRRDVRELERLRSFTSRILLKKKMELTQEYLGDSYDL